VRGQIDPRQAGLVCVERVDAHLHRVTGRDGQADLAGDESLPVFEPARVVTDDIGVGVDPGGGVEIDERRLEVLGAPSAAGRSLSACPSSS
jgi:hypothetical protein